jgi:hypothetical protein
MRAVCIFSVVFPQDLLEKGLAANNFAMLGLGDIVIPGIFIALLLRYDNRLDVCACVCAWCMYVCVCAYVHVHMCECLRVH